MKTAYAEFAPQSASTAVGRFLAGTAGAVIGSFENGVTRLTDRLITWQQRAADRRHLFQLDDHMLADVGLSRADVEFEAGKPFWKP